jgi:hypothetical protein
MTRSGGLPVEARQVLPLASPSTVLSNPLLGFLKKFFSLKKFKVQPSKLYPHLNRNCNQLRPQCLPTNSQSLLQKVLQIGEVAAVVGELIEMECGCGYL